MFWILFCFNQVILRLYFITIIIVVVISILIILLLTKLLLTLSFEIFIL